MSRYEFYTCSISELHKRIKGFMLREVEIKNFGNRRIANVILNGFNAFGGGKAISEGKMWPMELDKKVPKREVPKSEDIVKEEKDFIKRFWPDVNI